MTKSTVSAGVYIGEYRPTVAESAEKNVVFDDGATATRLSYLRSR